MVREVANEVAIETGVQLLVIGTSKAEDNEPCFPMTISATLHPFPTGTSI